MTEQARQAVHRWAQELIDLSNRNSLLNDRAVAPGQRRSVASSLELTEPAAGRLLELLLTGRGLPFTTPAPPKDPDGDREPPEPARQDDVVAQLRDRAQLERLLRTFARRAETDLADRGLRSLYVCFGVVDWREAPNTDALRAPLLFVPAALRRSGARSGYRLRRGEGDLAINPALVAKLEEFGLQLPAWDLDELEERPQHLHELLAQVRAAVTPAGWSVTEQALLKRGTFPREVMYRDLRDNEAQVLAHPIVRALADPNAVPPDLATAEVIAEDRIDEVAAPEDAYLVLDADASQRQAIEAAVRGVSFVMDGPPGTGKSQTITNTIAELIARGRSVLFVSEKMAALEVVANRLRHCGLNDFVLLLHQSGLTRRAVATALGSALEHHPRPGNLPSQARVRLAAQVRIQLSAYATAVNQVREPLGRSVGWVAGRLAQLHGVPSAPVADQVGLGLEAARAEVLLQRFAELANVWAPVAERERFRWHGLVEQPQPDREPDALQRLLDELGDAIAQLRESVPDLAFAAGLPEPPDLDGVARLLAVCAHCQAQPQTEASWWSHPQLVDLDKTVSNLAEQAAAHQRDLAVLASAYGAAWAVLPEDAGRQLAGALAALRRIWPDLGRTQDAVEEHVQVQQVLAFCSQTSQLAAELQTTNNRLAVALGASQRERTVHQIGVLAGVAKDADAPVRPVPEWADQSVHGRLAWLLDQLETKSGWYRPRRDRAAAVFAWPAVEDLHLDRMVARYGRGIGVRDWFEWSFWRDLYQLWKVAHARRLTRAVTNELYNAKLVKQLGQELDELEETGQPQLGSFYQPRATDTTGARHALERLERAAAQLGDDYDPVKIAAQLAGEAPADPQLAGDARQVLGLLAAWRDQGWRLLSDPTEQLSGLTLAELATWSTTTTAALRTCMELLATVNQHRRTPAGLHQALSELQLATAVHERRRRFDALPDAERALLGSRYQGLETPWEGLLAGVRWTIGLQERHGGPLPPAAVAALHASLQPPDHARLQQPCELACKHRADLLDRFEPARREELAQQLGGPLDEAAEVLADLADHLDQVEVWHAFAARTRWLRERGFAAAVDYCIQHVGDRTLLASVLEVALWKAWYAAVADSDQALAGVRAEDLDDRVARFRELDRHLVATAAALVIEACVQRRPTHTMGPAGKIRRQAQLRRGHWPIRKLLGHAGPVAKLLKPCFMMSPLTVSELLPADFTFDTVIFDEASQITPANAIGCLYRAKQIIVVGDPKQLPPTRFFQGSLPEPAEDEDDDEDTQDFESVLNLCLSAAHLPSLRLRWHYRSQHDSLIAFSNHEFYADRPLLVFPAAGEPREDLGVGFHHVKDGTWHGGERRYNDIEARRVAELACEHAARYPQRSLGIVTCNDDQAETIQDWLDQLRADRPELDAFFEEPDPLRRPFVRSIERVQGDERDHILFSVGYGRDEFGKLNLNFGPLIYKEGGWRRLNVAVTRARYRLDVVASFTADDLAARHSTNPSIVKLQRFLDYAQRGLAALAIDRSQSWGDLESPLEESVYATIRSWGYQVIPQVGTAGYRIDLAIRHPDLPGRFALGVECDGAAYHSSRVARDRDRLRQELLEGLGWQLYRIWGPAWYRDRRTQEQRLRAAIEAAVNTDPLPPATPADSPNDQRPSVVHVEVRLDQRPTWATTYQAYTADLIGPGDPTSYSERNRLTNIIEGILRREAPIHTRLLTRRVAELWNVRALPRLRETIESIVHALVRAGQYQLRNEFILPPDPADVPVRVPDPGDPRTIREITHIPNAELQAAICKLLRDAHALDQDELMTRVARLFGWEQTGSRIRAAVQQLLDQLLTNGHITQTADGRMQLK
jgi:very-short-patch-repair endonuclease